MLAVHAKTVDFSQRIFYNAITEKSTGERVNFMKKKLIAALLAATASVHFCSNAFADFLCMRASESTAITTDKNGDLCYQKMRDSKGELVAPIISSDGNTYLPLRYICDISGLTDANSPTSENTNTFRFVDNGDSDYIEFNINGTKHTHSIGTPFTYTAADNTTRNVAIYNLRGTLYAPMGYLASLTGAQALWDGRFSRIMFVGADIDANEYLNADNSLRRDKEMRLSHEIFNNNLTGSPLFLSVDGMTAVMHQTENIFRSNNTYFWSGVIGVRDGKLAALCHSMFGIKDRIYGIYGKPYGRLFTCDVTGGDFRYLTEKDVYNPIVVNTDLEYTIYYCDADTRSTLHMIRENTMDDYEIEITDFEHNNLLPEIKQFAVGLKNVYCLDTSGKFHVIDLDFPLTHASIARLKTRPQIHTHASDGTALDNITSMNYDHINDVVYITQTNGDTHRIYTYSPLTRQFNLLTMLEGEISGLALFYDASYANRLAVMTEHGIYDVRTEFDNGMVRIKE